MIREVRRTIKAVHVMGAALALTLSAGAALCSDSNTEAMIKAAVVYNLTKFVYWPEATTGTDSVFLVGLAGEDSLDPALETIEGKKVGSATIRTQSTDTPEALDLCRVVYVSESMAEGLEQLLESLHAAGILTVSEMEGFGERGGIIQLVRKGNKLRFKINLAAADRAGLRMSSKLLKMAELIDE